MITISRYNTMQAVILQNTREDLLDPVTTNYPLPLVPVVNKPLLCYQLEYLQSFGVREIIVSV